MRQLKISQEKYLISGFPNSKPHKNRFSLLKLVRWCRILRWWHFSVNRKFWKPNNRWFFTDSKLFYVNLHHKCEKINGTFGWVIITRGTLCYPFTKNLYHLCIHIGVHILHLNHYFNHYVCPSLHVAFVTLHHWYKQLFKSILPSLKHVMFISSTQVMPK